ncbi:hypothetical protein LZ32DRAFT_610424, partial [Colletotrichum eremochloae]
MVGATPNENLGWDLQAGAVPTIRDREPGQDRLFNSILKPAERDEKVKTSVVTVPGPLFTKLFTNSEDPTPIQCDVSKFRFLSHVRTVATEGTMSAIEGESGTFSIVMSHRIGPVEVDSPTPVMVHLVSLQAIDGLSLSKVKGKVLMTSLHSWTYTALPPGSWDVRSAFRNLGAGGKGLTVLQTDRTTTPKQEEPEKSKRTTIEELVTRRQRDGYTIVRHRTITGEQTAAMNRGPLVPTRVPHPLHSAVPMQSNFGTDLQILDSDLGLMDISYASAWQLGKTLALGDAAFTAALARLRGAIHRGALAKAKEDVFKRLGGIAGETIAYAGRRAVLSELGGVVSGLNNVNETLHATGMTAVSSNRWRRRDPVPEVDLALRSDHIMSQMYAQALYVSKDMASSADGGPYCYHTVPNNTDYAAVQEWILDKLHLAGIPSHYLLTDPSHLPEETLRFFHVDENWTDAMVDGALSLANHVTDDPAEDFCRSAIKARLNEYLATPIKGLGYCQQLPTYGFIIRSQLLVQFPDFAVSAVSEEQFHTRGSDWGNIKPTAPILVQRRLASDVMLVLFDREPPRLTFVVAAALLKNEPGEGGTVRDEIEIEHQKIYAAEDDKKVEKDPVKRGGWLGGGAKRYPMADLFDWSSRTMRVVEYARKIHEVLAREMDHTSDRDQYVETMATSAVFALQLNEPIYTLVIEPIPRLSEDSTLSDWEHVNDLSKPENRTSRFRFHPPTFPSHKYKPKTPLPVATPRALAQPVQLARFSRTNPIKLPPSPLPTPIQPHPEADSFPRFNLVVSPVEYRAFIPTNRPVPVDLIFSVLVAPDSLARFDYRLTKLELRVNLGETDDKGLPDPSDDVSYRPLLRRRGAREGPPPTVLSNLRFNLLLQVVPRTARGVNMMTLREASFVLPMADVIPWEVPRGKRKDGGGERYWRTWIKMTSYFLQGKDTKDPYTWDQGAEMLMKREERA